MSRARFLFRSAIVVMILGFGISRSSWGDPPAGPSDPLGPRLRVSLFKYAGATAGEARTHFSRFKGILRDKITVMVEELSGGGAGFDYLNGLSLEPQGEDGLEDSLSSETAVGNYWSASRSLVLLRGSIDLNGTSYLAQSRVYFGDLGKNLEHRSLSMRLPIAVDEVPNTSDSHSVAIYYALAMDAIRLKHKPAKVIALLSRAQDRFRDLANRGPLPPAVAELQRAVERSIVDEKARGSTP